MSAIATELRRLGLLALFSTLAFGQPAETAARFDAADVHASPPGTARIMTGGFMSNGRYELRHATLIDLIRTAYGVETGKVIGEPAWLTTNRFDVIAHAPPASTPDDLKSMLKVLLADRFALAVHADTKAMPAYNLTAGKKPQWKPASGPGASEGGSGCTHQSPPGPHGAFADLVQCRSVTAAAFAEWAGAIPSVRDYLNELSIVDKTGLNGAWDFTITWFSRRAITIGGADNVTFFDALDKQLGLKLELGTAPVSVIVIDKVNGTPVDNPPGTPELLSVSAVPSAFEVAEVKPSDPNDPSHMLFQVLPGGRVNVRNMPLGFLIKQVWHIRSDDLIAGAPKWFDSDRFDIVAKTTTSTPVDGQLMDAESIYPMIRRLLADRFKLVTHYEDRLVSAYALAAIKPHLGKSDDSVRSECRHGVGPDGVDPRRANPELTEVVSCRNTTMAQFTEQLPTLGAGLHPEAGCGCHRDQRRMGFHRRL